MLKQRDIAGFQDPMTQPHSHDGMDEPHVHNQRYPNHRLVIREDGQMETVKTDDGRIALTFPDEMGHSVHITMIKEQFTRLSEYAHRMGLGYVLPDNVTMVGPDEAPFDWFADPDDPASCKMLVAVNKWSTMLTFCAYGVSELHWKLVDALYNAKDAGHDVPACTCGRCPKLATDVWQHIFGNEAPAHTV